MDKTIPLCGDIRPSSAKRWECPFFSPALKRFNVQSSHSPISRPTLNILVSPITLFFSNSPSPPLLLARPPALQTRMAQLQHVEQSLSSGSTGDDENAELFSAVLSTLDREQLPLLASAILQRIRPRDLIASNTKPLGRRAHVWLLPCPLPVGL